MSKEEIMEMYEEDWDDPNMYFNVTEDGKIQKYDVENDLFFEYEIERVAH
jgi:hypothetical protein